MTTRFYLMKRHGAKWQVKGYFEGVPTKDQIWAADEKQLLPTSDKLSDLKRNAAATTTAIPFGVTLEAPGHFYQAVFANNTSEAAEFRFQNLKGRMSFGLAGCYAECHWVDELSKKELSDVFEV